MIHAFKFKDVINDRWLYLVLDVESGAIHELDESAFIVARNIELGLDPLQSGQNEVQVHEVLAEFEQLRNLGMLYTKEHAYKANEQTYPQIIKAMCLHVAHDCNLRCKYCFASTGKFKGERMLMQMDVAKAALDLLIARSGTRKNLEVDLFGGEPLLNFAAVEGIVSYGRQLEKQYGKVIRFTITTNALDLTAERMSYLNKEMHNVVLSLDGRKSVHDELRPTASGSGSFEKILPNILAFVAMRDEKEYYVRGTFTNRNLDFTQDVKFLSELGIKQISLEPVVLPTSSPYAIRTEHISTVLEEYDRLSEFVLKSRNAGKWFNFFHFMLDLENGPCLHKRIIGCGAGTEYVAVTPDGDIYPCHQFADEPGFKMGNVLTADFNKSLQQPFNECNIRTKEECKACWAKYFCSGGCAANAWKSNHNINLPDKTACVFERKRTECALGINVLEKLNSNKA